MPRAGALVAAAILTCLAVAPAMAQTPMSAQDFVEAAAQSDQYEIMAGRLAATQSENAAVQAFARQMIDEHTKSSQALQQATNASGLPPPGKSLGGDQQRMLNALQSLKGADLDKAYVTQQVNAHTAALVTEQAYAGAGADANLRKTAQSAVPLVQHHLEMARQLKSSMGRD